MARTDVTSLHGNWADGILTEMLSVDVSGGDQPINGLYRVIMVGSAGDVAIKKHDDTDDVLPALQPGVQTVFSCKAILQTGTTAGTIKLLR